MSDDLNALLARWTHRLALDDWRLTLSVVAADAMPEAIGPDAEGGCYFHDRYRTADIYLRSDLDEQAMRRTLLHEVQHVMLAELHELVSKRIVGDLVRPALRAHAEGLIDDAIEALVERLAIRAELVDREN